VAGTIQQGFLMVSAMERLHSGTIVYMKYHATCAYSNMVRDPLKWLNLLSIGAGNSRFLIT